MADLIWPTEEYSVMHISYNFYESHILEVLYVALWNLRDQNSKEVSWKLNEIYISKPF